MKLSLRIFTLAPVLLLLASCAAPATPAPASPASSAPASSAPASSAPAPSAPALPPSSPEQTYYLSLDQGKLLLFDRDGNLLSTEERLEPVGNLLTQKPLLKSRTRVEPTGEKDENGYPITRRLSALYDLQGKQLTDFEEYVYMGGFGDYLWRMDSERYQQMGGFDDGPSTQSYTALWNYKTGQELLPQIGSLQALDDHTLLVSSITGELLGTLDATSPTPVLHPCPPGYWNAQSWNGHILVITVQWQEKDTPTLVLDRDFKPLFSRNAINGSYFGLRGPYFLYDDPSGVRGVANQQNETLYLATGENIDYFDGRVMVLQTIGNQSKRLTKADGTSLSPAYDNLTPLDDYRPGSQQPAPGFVGAREGRAELLSPEGTVTVSVEIPGLKRVQPLELGLYSYTVLPQANAQGSSEELYGLLDAKLNILLPADHYNGIYTMSNWTSGKAEATGLLQCSKTLPGGITRMDILDTTGKLLIENLTHVGDVSSDRIAAVKGFSAGLLDRQGQWVGKQSLFSSFEDEKERIF